MKSILRILSCLLFACQLQAQQKPTEYINPFLGTATLWDSTDLGFTPTHRAWGAEVFPGTSLPNAMVQLTPVTQFRSGSGYQYEDTVIYGFAHSSKGHWNLCNIPLLPVTGEVNADAYASGFSHQNESAQPGYYQVYLKRYGINVQLTSTLRCGFHQYTADPGKQIRLLADLSKSNEPVRTWNIQQVNSNVFTGFQQTGGKMYFYATSSRPIQKIDSIKAKDHFIPVVEFAKGTEAVSLRIGFSFVSIQNAKENLEKEMLNKTFAQVRNAATKTWNQLLSKITVKGGSLRQKRLFYSCLYRSFLWPVLRSDINGEFTDDSGIVRNKGFRYYSLPSLWDTYRNKLVLLGMLTPDVANDVISSMINKGEIAGFMPTFFHGDHAAVFIAGTYLRGLRNYDVKTAYQLLLNNATKEGGTRPYITEYASKGYIATPDIKNPTVPTKAKAAVTKTLEYAYDDYALALLANALHDSSNYKMLMARTDNYKNVFDEASGFMRGRLADGSWVTPFDPKFPYYEYMYREANAWQSSFFVPHDVIGLIALYHGKAAFEKKLDQFFSIPWNGVEADNLTGFIGQYCQGNQPDHSNPFLYYFVGKQQKTQILLDSIMNHFYDMGKDKLAYAGMDDAGEMSAWYVFNAMGFYPFSPADPKYIVSVPLFDKTTLELGGKQFSIIKPGKGNKIESIQLNKKSISGYFIEDADLRAGGELLIKTLE
ncbi:MAG TPA: GH92 family glycosyl hydrolase [Arachidicoccus sp.]|nr:GH92 family glycosyl hydrolase [Arachidicoccus sp.]